MTVSDLSLHELVDLSLGTPEVVNYKGLRTLLLTIVDCLKLGDIKAQLNEEDKKDLIDGRDAVRKASLNQSASIVGSVSNLNDGSFQELERKVSMLETQLESLNSLPSNEDLMQRVTSHDSVNQAPVSEMWQLMQVKKKAENNEEGVSKLMSMVEHLIGEFKELKDDLKTMKNQMNKFGSDITHLKDQMNKVTNNNSTISDRLKQLESSSQNQDKIDELQKLLSDLSNRWNNLPPLDLIVTWPAMEDALKGVYREPVVMTNTLMQTSPMTESLQMQTMPTSHSYTQTTTPPPSRPGTSQSYRSESSAAHPSKEIQKILKDIGELNGKHNLLEDRVRGLEELVAKKANMSDVEKMILDNAIPADLQATIAALKDGQEQLKEFREKPPQPEQNNANTVSSQVVVNLDSQIKQINERIGSLEDLLDNKLTYLGKKMQKVKQHVQSGMLTGKLLPPLDQEKTDKVNSSMLQRVDSEMVGNMTSTILELQAEVEKLNATCIHLVDEHNAKQKHIDALYTFIDRLQENKADKEHVTMEIDVKADKRALENKISRAQFEGAVGELSRNLNNVMEKLSGHKSAWEEAVSELKLDVENKLDRMELDPLKAYLDSRIKNVSAKVIRKAEPEPEDAAGFRKPLIQKFHCISCDRPLDMAPQAPLASLPESRGLPGTRSGRPYTTFELEQIRAAQKSNHFTDVPDYFVTSRSCGGSHTLTHPHRRVTRITQMSNIIQSEDIPGPIPVVNGRVETDIQGQDGHIYKARVSPGDMGHLPNLQPKVHSSKKKPSNNNPFQKRSHTAPSQSKLDQGPLSPRPTSARNPSRPTSARPGSSRPQSSRGVRSPTLPANGADRPITPSNTIDPVDDAIKQEDVTVPPPSAQDGTPSTPE